jgi:pimeloyl-ACP methyl ester carboxylesterase
VAAGIALVDHLGPCVLIGHSHGGYAAEVAAARPELVRACVLIEPHGELAPPPAGTGPQLLVRGDFLDEDHLDPVYRGLVAAWEGYRAAAISAGVRVDVLDLVAGGITGNTHMLMCDDNSHQVAALVARWLAASSSSETVRSKTK